MKYGFNNTNLITGYIKELLKDFNLPTCKVYNPDKFEPKPSEIYESAVRPIDIGRSYIYKNYFYIGIGEGKNKRLKKLGSFESGLEYLGVTKNLIIKSNYYDQYTHEYLGDYLRFVRDYFNINLMPLYNCYSGYWTSSVNKYFVKTSTRQKYNLSNSGEYKYYIFPVKFFERYTISLSSNVPVEVFLMLSEDSDLNMEFIDGKKDLSGNTLFKSSLKKYHSFQKKNPEIYDTYEFSSDVSKCYSDYWTHEENLRMVIKIPYWIDTSISVLEGDYRINTSFLGDTFFPKLPVGQDLNEENLKKVLDKICGIKDDLLIDSEETSLDNISEVSLDNSSQDYINYINNHTILKSTDCNLDDGLDIYLLYFTKLSLLQNISTQSFPFADRLVEYLFNLPITKNNTIVNNVKRIQNRVYNRIGYKDGFKGYSDVFDNNLRNNIYTILNENLIFTKNGEYKVNKIGNLQKPFNYEKIGHPENNKDGLGWKDLYNKKDEINSETIKYLYSSLIDRKSDILYWVDKDVEGLVDSL